jgi:hypothetical protein
MPSNVIREERVNETTKPEETSIGYGSNTTSEEKARKICIKIKIIRRSQIYTNKEK